MENYRHSEVLAFALLSALGCASHFEPDLQHDVTAESAPSIEGAGAQADENGLTLSHNTSEAVSGTLSRGSESIAFDMERAGEQRVTAVYGADGGFLLRLTLGDATERLELGSELSVEGPPGSVFVNGQPDWSRVKVSGELARAAESFRGEELELMQALGPALAARPDIDLAMVPASYRASTEAGASANGSVIGTARQALGSGIDCGGCTLACQLDFGLCLGLAGILGFVCIRPLENCMQMCDVVFCQ